MSEPLTPEAKAELREWAKGENVYGDYFIEYIEAVSVGLLALLDENERLENNRHQLNHAINGSAGNLVNGASPLKIAEGLFSLLDRDVFDKDNSLEEEIDALDAELARYKAAVERVLAILNDYDTNGSGFFIMMTTQIRQALAEALAGEGK